MDGIQLTRLDLMNGFRSLTSLATQAVAAWAPCGRARRRVADERDESRSDGGEIRGHVAGGHVGFMLISNY